MTKPPGFMFYVKDWLASERVTLMTGCAEGLYARLLALCWDNESLPADEEALKVLVPKHRRCWARCWPQVKPCFQRAGSRLTHSKLNAQRLRLQELSATRAEAGRKGASARGNCQAIAQQVPSIAVAVAVAGEVKDSAPTAPERQATQAGTPRGAHGELMPLIRTLLWDGECPGEILGEPWDERREGSVVKSLLRHYSVSQLRVAIEGLGNLRRGYGERPEWLPLGAKWSTLALNRNHSGTRDMVAVATEAYWFVANKRGTSAADVPSVGAILTRAMKQGAV